MYAKGLMAGQRTLAGGGYFVSLCDVSDADGQAARKRIEAQNARNRAQRCRGHR